MPRDLWCGEVARSLGLVLIKLYRLVRSQPLESPKRTDKAGGVKVGCSDATEAVGNAQLLAVIRESPDSCDSHVCWLWRLATLAMHTSC